MAYLFTMKPSNRIRELRKKAGLTQDELAQLAGISQPAISQIENDTRPLTVDWMRTLARIFACSTADILGEEDNPLRPTEDEQRLLEHYRSADPAQRELIERVAEPLSEFHHQGDDPGGRLLPRKVA